MSFKRIVLLAGKWHTTPLVYHFLEENFGIRQVMIENGVPRKEFLKRRAKKLGWFTVAGQVLFQLAIAKPMGYLSKKRINEIKEQYQLNDDAIPEDRLLEVSSVNSEQCSKALKEIGPDLVIVHGTRIISKKILQEITCPFINIHAGITPRYRGSHGAYWALANGDREHCGVTVHLVDPGIDTGNILAQTTIPFTSGDNFVTYPYLQLAEGLKLLPPVVQKLQNQQLCFIENDLDSGLWHHPTLWGYVRSFLTKKIK